MPVLHEKELLEPLLNGLIDAVLLVDDTGTVRLCNRATTTLFGWEREELVGAPLSRLVDLQVCGAALPSESWRRDTARCADGSSQPVNTIFSHTAAGMLDTPTCTVLLRDAREELAAEADLARQKEELRLQQCINEALHAASDIEDLLMRAMVALVNMAELEVQSKAGVFLLQDGRLHLHSTYGAFSQEFLEKEATVDLGCCLCGKAAESGQVLISEDCFADERHEHSFVGMSAHGHYILPLKAAGQVLGVLFLYTDPAPNWDERRLALFETLGTQIGMALARSAAMRELQRAKDRLEVLATRDALTGALNRRAVMKRLTHSAARSAREGEALSVIMMDLDHFKTINDTWGHPGGDEVLRATADRIQQVLRPYDVLGRYGGEEFIVVLEHTGLQLASAIAERIRGVLIAVPVPYGDGAIPVYGSFGVAELERGEPVDEVVRRADQALYEAKRHGRNRVHARRVASAV